MHSSLCFRHSKITVYCRNSISFQWLYCLLIIAIIFIQKIYTSEILEGFNLAWKLADGSNSYLRYNSNKYKKATLITLVVSDIITMAWDILPVQNNSCWRHKSRSACKLSSSCILGEGRIDTFSSVLIQAYYLNDANYIISSVFLKRLFQS